MPADRLVAALWGDAPPPGAATALRAYVSRLRGVLGAAATLRAPPARLPPLPGRRDPGRGRVRAAHRGRAGRRPPPATTPARSPTSTPRSPCGGATRWPSSPTTTSPRPTAARLTELRTSAPRGARRGAARAGSGGRGAARAGGAGAPPPVPGAAGGRAHAGALRDGTAGRRARRLPRPARPSRRRAGRRARRSGAGALPADPGPRPGAGRARARQGNLPRRVSGFVGRDREVERVLAALRAESAGHADRRRRGGEVPAGGGGGGAGPGPVRRRGVALRAGRPARRQPGRARRRRGAADPAAARPVDRADRDRVPARPGPAARRWTTASTCWRPRPGWSPRSCSSARGSWCSPPAGSRSASTASSCGRCRRCRSSRRDRAVRAAGPGGVARTSGSTRPPPTRWPRSAPGSTGCRWASSSPRPGCG